MKEIPLSVRSRRKNYGLFTACVDDVDAQWIEQHDWSADVRTKDGNQIVYAYRWIRNGFGRSAQKRKRYMHVDVATLASIAIPDGFVIDHRNSNGLDNTRRNLRASTLTQNTHNARKQIRNNSGFKGVSWHKQSGSWRARIKVNNKEVALGLFATVEAAALAYDAAAVKYRGDFARLNFPERAA